MKNAAKLLIFLHISIHFGINDYLCDMIFYFSGTGNTAWAAKQLAHATGEKLFFIPEEAATPHTYELAEDERIGFCFPVHGWQPPRVVRQFIRQLSFKSEGQALQQHFCYALVTCGDSIGRTMELLNSELEPLGIEAVSTFALIMPESYVCLPLMYTDTPEKEQQKITKADEQLDQFAKLICQRKAGEHHTVRGITPWLFSHVIGAYFNSHMITDRKFTVDAELCIHCGRCSKVCPTGDLQMHKQLPSWRHDGSCTCCLACYHHCPRHAINYGSITRKRGQYYYGHGESDANSVEE